MVRKQQPKKLDPSIYENLHVLPCPNCTGTDLYSPDGENINCRNCEGVRSPAAFAQHLDREAKRK